MASASGYQVYSVTESITHLRSFGWSKVIGGQWWLPEPYMRDKFPRFFDDWNIELLNDYFVNQIDKDKPYWMDIDLENVNPEFKNNLTPLQKTSLNYLMLQAFIHAPRIHYRPYSLFLEQTDMIRSMNGYIPPNFERCLCLNCQIHDIQQ